MTMLFFEIFHTGLPRQGPGDAVSTLKALALVPNVGPETQVLDVGSGTGAQTFVLATNSPAHITAVDTHAPFIDVVKREAQSRAFADRIDAYVGDMRQLAFAPNSFDLIWCEGAIYIMGVATALREWRRLLTPGGHIAITEVCWMKPGPPPECAAFWAQEYPAIRDVASVFAVVRDFGYESIGHFALPTSAWWDDFYQPLQGSVTQFRERHAQEPDAQELAEQVQREIDIWHTYADFYGYEFFVMRAR
jgi:ubiquinone/menaquinone biosynthesis C-methylase UbiE